MPIQSQYFVNNQNPNWKYLIIQFYLTVKNYLRHLLIVVLTGHNYSKVLLN